MTASRPKTRTHDLPTAERVRQLLNYNPTTGVFTRLTSVNRFRVGDVVGTVNKGNGYRYIYVDNVQYLAHRLAFLWMTGEWPPEDIDHHDGDRDDNRWRLIRPGSRQLNMQNRRTPGSTNKSGFLGVCWHARAAKWRASIKHPDTGKHVHLGLFVDPEPAHIVYVMAKRELHQGCTI